MIILDVKPWDDETDMAEMEKNVRSIEMDGLLWGTSKLVAVGYGIKKLQISCVVEDDKVSTDDLEDKIVAFEDFVSHCFIIIIITRICCAVSKDLNIIHKLYHSCLSPWMSCKAFLYLSKSLLYSSQEVKV